MQVKKPQAFYPVSLLWKTELNSMPAIPTILRLVHFNRIRWSGGRKLGGFIRLVRIA